MMCRRTHGHTLTNVQVDAESFIYGDRGILLSLRGLWEMISLLTNADCVNIEPITKEYCWCPCWCPNRRVFLININETWIISEFPYSFLSLANWPCSGFSKNQMELVTGFSERNNKFTTADSGLLIIAFSLHDQWKFDTLALLLFYYY